MYIFRIICQFSDKEEFLYLLNLKNADIVQPHPWSAGGEQGFINEVYLWERLDLGLDTNMFLLYILDPRYTVIIEHLNVTIYHFARHKPDTCKEGLFYILFPFIIAVLLFIELNAKVAK